MIHEAAIYLANNLSLCAFGVTCALVVGVLLTVITRAPHPRQRMAEMSLVATLAWLIAIHTGWFEVPHQWHLNLRDSAVLPTSNSPATTSEPITSEHSLVANQERSRAVENSASVPSGRTAPIMREALRTSDDSVPVARSIPPNNIRWSYAMAFAACLGTIALAGWLILGRTVLWAWRWRSQSPPAWLSELYSEIGPVRHTTLRMCRHVRQPCSYGVWFPVILLPTKMCDSSRRSELRHVLLHEQAHVDRRDAWGHFLCDICLLLFYWHPCYWWLRRQIAICRELLADDAAVRKSSVECYVKDLTTLARHWQREPFLTLGVMGMKNRQFDFCDRMEKLLSRKQALQHSSSAGWRIGTLILLATLVWLGAAITPAAITAPAESSEQHDNLANDTANSETIAVPNGDEPKPLEAAIVASENLNHAAATIPLPLPPQPTGFRGFTEFKSSTLSANISGIVSRVLKSPGDNVKLLEVVAEMDAGDLQRGLARAQYDLELAMAQEAVAQSELDGVQSERATAYGALQSAKRSAEEGVISATEIQNYSAAVTQKSSSVRTAEAQLQAAQVKVKLAKLNVDAAQQLVKSSQIVSNVDGRIDEVLVRPGEFAAAGAPLVKIFETRTAYVTAAVPFSRFHPAQLHGQPAVVEIPISGDRRFKVEGTIESTASNVLADGHFRITVALNNVPKERVPLLMGGVEATVFVIQVAPNEVQGQGGKWADFVEQKDGADQRNNRDREISVLQDKIAQLSTIAKRIDALHDKGAAGGEVQHHAAVFYQLRHAEAQLAELRGDTNSQLEFLSDAVLQAKRRHEALSVALEAGTTTLDQLLDATEELAAIQLEQQRVAARLKGDQDRNPAAPMPGTD